MSETTANAQAPDEGARSLDDIADELYGLRPDTFAAARDEYIRKARAEKRTALARELGSLRRPTQSAWLVNLLWRDQRDVIEQLFELATELGRAQAQASGSELRSLTAQRRDLEAALLRRAHVLAANQGVRVTDAMEREAQDTLAAAVAQPSLAAEVRTGRLVKPMAYAGFGPLVLPAPAALESGGGGAPAPIDEWPRSPAREPTRDVIELRAAQQARERRQAAQQRLAEARTAVEVTAGAVAESGQAADRAQLERQQLQQELAALKAQLRNVEEQVSTADQAALAASRHRHEVEQTHQAALRALHEAEEALHA